MEGYRYQQLAYLIVPVIAGIEFFRCARAIRKTTGRESVWTVIMDICGYLFMGIIPALFLFTIMSLEHDRDPVIIQALHRLDRYGVMFFFLGSWWQVFLITALRARRLAEAGGKSTLLFVWIPYLVLGSFVSALILWAAPFYLMWVSVFWFLASFGLLAGLQVSPQKISKIFFVFAIVVVAGENIFFIILDAII